MTGSLRVPTVWVVASHRLLTNPSGHTQLYTVMDEGGQRTMLNMGLQPMCYPRAPLERVEELLANVDGILLGGSDTNVHPRYWGEEPARPEFQYDTERDELAHALVRLGIARRIPVIGFCRGSQDINTALGGSLHQWLRDLPDMHKHWEDPDENLEEQYVERHFVSCTPRGALERITQMGRFPVSSLHSQGANRLGEGLVAEARADDGLVEAFRWHDEESFCWGFQFHPEWGWRWHPAYGRIMSAFERACWERLARRTEQRPVALQPVAA
ncbi:gamma-glutamyl-gamma-aminobutyrate hydrolase family protein [Ramlibacter ginsenosidimutans]|uniref:Gamma-glutamyl-gamma-aminobutyrate hydrolase family protein n=1 Tax=Ramlibacter ginsenosidimutans TaxID=502333 RepID=A0A934TP39_9BURK|nr:gamma-glutamyl-gamma-aminobutyrate hydrolase family protein [Ramlibacter ginsenosidimutans]MBK6004919.1 gamma-glutamyl-gamma-aminobutyrate hydrolase family protein [Ramlibacter ginsenosidimutans]